MNKKRVWFRWLRWPKWTWKGFRKKFSLLLLYVGWVLANAGWVVSSYTNPNVDIGGFVAICGAGLIVAAIPLALYLHWEDWD